MGECVIRIERLANGYEVEITDPAIVKANQSRQGSKPWRNPKINYAFKTVEEVLAFLSKNLEKALPMDDYSTSFDAAAGDSADE